MQSLIPFHTFALPVKAKQIIEIDSIEQLQQAWNQCVEEKMPLLFLGQGSNVVFVEDFAGAVFVNRLQGIEHRQDKDFHYLHVCGGENWHQLVQWSLAQGIYGLENLALIPGCAGSAPVQNIGAYGVEFKDLCDYVEVLDLQGGNLFRLSRAECEFGYRDSIFKHQYSQGYVVTAIGLKLAKDWRPVLQYGSLTALDASQVSARQIFDEVCRVRRSKLPDPKEFGNAGSFFKNPLIEAQAFSALRKSYPDIPHFPQADGKVKLAAGWLIDQCGLKGYRIGGAEVHRQQALVLINAGNASGRDVVRLAAHICNAVENKFGVRLSPEVRFMGAQGELNGDRLIAQV
ncbi:UDP-N-acetylmuramate dehydrogenase [Mesocricetibacter intestinalis]|uniref:UDP-N-acetylenolpyruvoylglucosamine reductase n=1 Tax=Mesocricetibacter intestinalis TaxID=1521930 RepID=A0A4R6VAY4_9PAST|nr:UDP-N-acetylmuramate dehydrogenase [Mesocricetibacter intestinalis]TDQ59368.1 UDP-N-acetylmuramate dehydrogenase [Mesocricetibacter intestinalis]